jgi:NAD(P)-dependent dehydrogenase (short-subunit alcohol dehydrogenase family)
VFDFLDLKDKRILVTGASSGIGHETSILLSRLGVKTALAARNEEKLKQTIDALEGNNHSYYCFDFKEISGIEELVQRIVDDGGKLDGLVHCAGITKEMPLQLTVFEAIHEIMLVNFYSLMELVRVFSKKKINNNGGSIVVMSSTASLAGASALSAYCASKAALDGAVRALARELHAKKIRVNSVMACFVKTPMSDEYFETFGETETAKYSMMKQYMGMIDPLCVASTIVFLLSSASFYINGSAIPVDGGSLS